MSYSSSGHSDASRFELCKGERSHDHQVVSLRLTNESRFYAQGSTDAGQLFFKPGFRKEELTMRDEVWLCDANLSLSWHPLLLCFALTSFPLPLTSCFARHLVSFHTVTSTLFPQHMSWTPHSLHPPNHLSPIHSLTLQHTQLSALLHFKQPSISSVSFPYCSHLSLSFFSSPRTPLIPLRTFPLNKFVPGFLLTGSSACGLSSSGVFRDMIWTSNSNFH